MTEHVRLSGDKPLYDLLRDMKQTAESLQTRPFGTAILRDEDTDSVTIIGTLPDGSTGIDQWVGDTTPPPVPSAPFVQALAGQFSVTWDGLFEAGAPMPRDYSYCEIIGYKVNGVATPVPVVCGRVSDKETIVYVSTDIATAGDTWRFTFVAVDYVGNRSMESIPSADVMMQAAGTDPAVYDRIDAVEQEAQDAKNDALAAQKAANDAQQAANSAQANALNMVAGANFEETPTDEKLFINWDSPTQTVFPYPNRIQGEVPYAIGGPLVNNVGTGYPAYSNPLAIFSKAPITCYPNRTYKLSIRIIGLNVTSHSLKLGYFINNTSTPTAFPNSTVDVPVDISSFQLVTVTVSNVSTGYFGIFGNMSGTDNFGVLLEEPKLIDITDVLAAQTRADQAYNQAVAAATAAGTAQSTADGKNRAWYQNIAPPTTGNKVNDQWYDTANGNRLNIWNGSAWTSIQDSAILAAQNTANSAQTSANGKNTIYYQATQPSGGTYKTGDTWYDTANGYRMSTWTGSAWQITQDSANALTVANGKNKIYLQSTAPTSPVAGDLWIDSANKNQPKRWSGSAWVDSRDQTIADAQTAANNAQTSANGKNTIYRQGTTPPTTNRVVGDTWFNTSDGNKISTWDGSAWTLNPFGTNAIANLAITNALIANLDAAKITTGYLDANRIQAQSITGNLIAANTVTAANMVAGTITAASGIIADATITTAKIADLAVTNAKISTLDAAKITTGFLDANRIDAKTITVEKLLIGSVDNIFADPNFIKGNLVWAYTAQTSTLPSGGLNGGPAMRITGNGSAISVYNNPQDIAIGGAPNFKLLARVKSSVALAIGSVVLTARWKNAAGTITYSTISNNPALVSGVWTNFSGIVVPPADAVSVSFAVGVASNVASGQTVDFDYVAATRASDATTIANGAIQTQHMEAGSIDAGVLVAQSITGIQIAAKAITVDKLVIGDTNNLCLDPNLATPSFWTTTANTSFVTSATSGVPANAPAATLMKMNSVNAANDALYNNGLVNNSFVVAPGEAYAISFWLSRDSATNSNFRVGLDCTDVAGTTHSYQLTNPAITPASVSAGTWIRYTTAVTIPTGFVNARLMFGPAQQASPAGSWYITGVFLRRAATGELIVDGAIDGRTITGATIQTSRTVATNGGIILDPTKFAAYNPSGVQTFNVDALTGLVTATGTFSTRRVFPAGAGTYTHSAEFGVLNNADFIDVPGYIFKRKSDTEEDRKDDAITYYVSGGLVTMMGSGATSFDKGRTEVVQSRANYSVVASSAPFNSSTQSTARSQLDIQSFSPVNSKKSSNSSALRTVYYDTSTDTTLLKGTTANIWSEVPDTGKSTGGIELLTAYTDTTQPPASNYYKTSTFSLTENGNKAAGFALMSYNRNTNKTAQITSAPDSQMLSMWGNGFDIYSDGNNSTGNISIRSAGTATSGQIVLSSHTTWLGADTYDANSRVYIGPAPGTVTGSLISMRANTEFLGNIGSEAAPTSYSNGWSDFSAQSGQGAYSPARFVKLSNNIGYVDLMLKAGTIPGTAGQGVAVCTIPVGYRPAYIQNMTASAAVGGEYRNACMVQLHPNGTVTIYGLATLSVSYISLHSAYKMS